MLLTLCGCAPFQKTVIDPAFATQVRKWNGLYPSHRIDNITVQFASLEQQKTTLGEVVGECLEDASTLNTTYTINIDPTYWNEAGDVLKEQILFHEAGHCVFHLLHNCSSTTLADEPSVRPASIMNPYTFAYSSEDAQYYYNELSTDVSNCP